MEVCCNNQEVIDTLLRRLTDITTINPFPSHETGKNVINRKVLTGRSVLAWISADDELVEETRELCLHAGYRVVREVRQKRREPDPKFYLGPGKIRELKDENDAEFVVTPTDLDPTQIFNISKATGLSVSDRIRVVLELFHSRATSPEARLQVEMADIRYQIPILREYIHQGTLSDRPGFMAGGEYRVDYYYEMARKRMAHIRELLRKERKRRGRTRYLRKRRGTYLVSVAGYTNAGKSTLVNALSRNTSPDKTLETADRMFTTIATSTRRMRGRRDCMITDTVGFIRALPPWLIEGFMSTLEELFSADVVLLVVDASEGREKIASRLGESMSILRNGNCSGRILLVLNKIDLLDDDEPLSLLDMVQPGNMDMMDEVVPVSAASEEGISELIEAVNRVLPPTVSVSIRVPMTEYSPLIASWIHANTFDVRIVYTTESAVIKCRMEKRWMGHLEGILESVGGAILVSDRDGP